MRCPAGISRKTLALAGSVLSGRRHAGEYAVAETHRLGDAPYYVALAQAASLCRGAAPSCCR